MDTNEIVTELYALRAGLSLIAQETDKFDAEIAVAEEQKKAAIAAARAAADSKIQKSNDSVAQAQQSVQEAQRSVQDSQQSVQDAQKELSSAELNAKQRREEYEKKKELASQDHENIIKVTKRNMSITLAFEILLCIFCLVALILVPILSFIDISPISLIPILVISLAICITEFITETKTKSSAYEVGISFILNIIICGLILLFDFLYTAGNDTAFVLLIVSVILYIPTGISRFIITAVHTHLHKSDYKTKIWDYERQTDKSNNAKKNLDTYKQEVEEAESRYQQLLNENGNVYHALRRANNAYERADDTLENLKKTSKSTIENAENDYDEQRKKAENQYQEAYNVSAETHGKISSEIWDTLVKTYDDLLDVRDWEILDLVIWQLETGRADTIKEALQLADRETQTDRIVRTMQSASEAIAQRIDTGFGNLQSQLSSSFYTLAMGLTRATSELSYQIKSSSNKLADRIDASSQATAQLYESQQDALLEQRNSLLATSQNLEQLFSQASLQTALLEKSNSSSKELIAAVNKLRKA